MRAYYIGPNNSVLPDGGVIKPGEHPNFIGDSPSGLVEDVKVGARDRTLVILRCPVCKRDITYIWQRVLANLHREHEEEDEWYDRKVTVPALEPECGTIDFEVSVDGDSRMIELLSITARRWALDVHERMAKAQAKYEEEEAKRMEHGPHAITIVFEGRARKLNAQERADLKLGPGAELIEQVTKVLAIEGPDRGGEAAIEVGALEQLREALGARDPMGRRFKGVCAYIEYSNPGYHNPDPPHHPVQSKCVFDFSVMPRTANPGAFASPPLKSPSVLRQWDIWAVAVPHGRPPRPATVLGENIEAETFDAAVRSLVEDLRQRHENVTADRFHYDVDRDCWSYDGEPVTSSEAMAVKYYMGIYRELLRAE